MEGYSVNYICRKLPFIQHNDNKHFKTHFQCPNCHSYETDKQHVYANSSIIYIKRICYDCGYTFLYNSFTRGVDDNDNNQ